MKYEYKQTYSYFKLSADNNLLDLLGLVDLVVMELIRCDDI